MSHAMVKEFKMLPKTSRRLSLRIFLRMLLCALSLLGTRGNANAQSRVPLPLTLSQAIDLALRQNRGLKLAELAVVENENNKEMARAAYLPHIKNESSLLHVT